MVFLKLFLHLPVVLSSSPLKILEGFCCGIHSNRIHVIRNDLICFIEEGLFCLYNGSKTDKIWNYIFQWGQSSMVAIGPVRLCLVKIYIFDTADRGQTLEACYCVYYACWKHEGLPTVTHN